MPLYYNIQGKDLRTRIIAQDKDGTRKATNSSKSDVDENIPKGSECENNKETEHQETPKSGYERQTTTTEAASRSSSGSRREQLEKNGRTNNNIRSYKKSDLQSGLVSFVFSSTSMGMKETKKATFFLGKTKTNKKIIYKLTLLGMNR